MEKIHKTLYFQQLARLIQIFVIENETADPNDSFSHSSQVVPKTSEAWLLTASCLTEVIEQNYVFLK